MATNPSPVDPARRLTISNAITALRIVGSPVLVLLALNQQLQWVALALALLVLTEWLDGFLARSLHQESALGARLDTIADISFYGSLLAALVLLFPNTMRREAVWIAAAVGSYLLSWLVALLKFGKMPSYHTWAAKSAWIVVGVGTVALVTGWAGWPFRLAMVMVLLANVEAVAITLALQEPRVNVPTFWHVKRRIGGD
jgi:CDP-diacylglycerol--glycerol-3-phosphate 3-phosphatidyltransferase